MDLDEKDIELIDKYVRGELTGNVLKDFKQRLTSDTAFAEQVGWHEKLVGGIKKQSRKELKAYLQSLDTQVVSSIKEPASEKKVATLTFWKYAVAAAVALLVAAVFWFDLLHPSPATLFAQYYQPYPNVEATIERNDEVADAYQQAFQWYEDGQYEEASAAFEQLLQTDVPSEALNFYAGLTSLELNQFGKSLQYFEKVIKHPDHKYYQQALWYAALASLKNQDTESAKKYLHQLSGEKGFYGDKAVQLLEELYTMKHG